MAQLQNHAAQWGPPPRFARGRVDWPIEAARQLPDPLAPEILAAIEALATTTLSAPETAAVGAVLERVQAAERALGRGPAPFGLIHADLHYGNVLFARDTVRAIDFDDCGFGPRLFDLAVMLSPLLARAEYPALRAGLLAGYRRVRPLPAADEGYLDTFIALRRVQDALWMLQWRTHPALGDDWAAEACATLAPLAAFLATGTAAPRRDGPG